MNRWRAMALASQPNESIGNGRRMPEEGSWTADDWPACGAQLDAHRGGGISH